MDWQKCSGIKRSYLVPFVEGDKLSPRLVTNKDISDICISSDEFKAMSN
ncbi:hypothetical protein [Shigella boydii]